jgi:hypothetical protein
MANYIAESAPIIFLYRLKSQSHYHLHKKKIPTGAYPNPNE